ncbi:MAG: NAD-dependent epimerase/dehydratase family protein [Deltaproteobacteria bacterium]|nr:NAD-dependent epimerase/dehydratase family protein [Deltaproteobacteria bacterium]
MKKVLVTGGGGFVGFAISKRLLNLGIEPVVMGRSRYVHVDKLGIRQYPGDIRDIEAVRRAAAGCDTVFHVAAKAGIWGRKRDYFSINLAGTENIIRVCRDDEISRLIYTSTPSVVFNGRSIAGGGRTIPYAARFLCHYAFSKAAAEQLVLAANSTSLATVALRPHLIWGPGDSNLIPRLVARGREGQLRQVGDGANLVDIAYIDNVVEAHILAAKNLTIHGPAAGRAYFISQGEPVNLWNWINALFGRLHIPPVNKKISFAQAYLAGAVFEAFYRLAGIQREPVMTRFLAQQLAKSHWFSMAAAKDDLGYSPLVSTEEGMDRLVDWLA